MGKQLIIIGASGQGKVIADIAENNGYTDIVFLDDDTTIKKFGSYQVVGSSETASSYAGNDFIVGIGNSAIRKKKQEELIAKGLNVISLIHPKAVIAGNVKIGNGTVVMAGAVVSNNVHICENCMIRAVTVVVQDISEPDTYICVPNRRLTMIKEKNNRGRVKHPAHKTVKTAGGLSVKDIQEGRAA